MIELERFFTNIFNLLSRDYNQVLMLAVFIGALLFVILLRIITHLHFRTQHTAFSFEAKGLDKREEVSRYRNGLLRRAAAEYKQILEKAVIKVTPEKVVQKVLSRMSMLGIKYTGIMPFVEAMERGILFIGLIMSFIFNESAFVFGGAAIIGFLLLRIFAGLFNFREALESFSIDMQIYLERELGRFFATDTGGTILRLKNELTESISNQTKMFERNIKHMTDSFAESNEKVSKILTTAIKNIGPSIADIMDEKLVNMNENLKEVIKLWETAVSKSERLQTLTNDSADKINKSADKLTNAGEFLSKYLQGHTDAMSSQLIALLNAIDTLKEAVTSNNHGQESLKELIGYIEKNQHILEKSISSYEQALKNLTSAVGDGLGVYIDLHAQKAAETINDTMKSVSERITHLTHIVGETIPGRPFDE